MTALTCENAKENLFELQITDDAITHALVEHVTKLGHGLHHGAGDLLRPELGGVPGLQIIRSLVLQGGATGSNPRQAKNPLWAARKLADWAAGLGLDAVPENRIPTISWKMASRPSA